MGRPSSEPRARAQLSSSVAVAVAEVAGVQAERHFDSEANQSTGQSDSTSVIVALLTTGVGAALVTFGTGKPGRVKPAATGSWGLCDSYGVKHPYINDKIRSLNCQRTHPALFPSFDLSQTPRR